MIKNKLVFNLLFLFLCYGSMGGNNLFPQCRAYIKIDGNLISADPTTVSTGLALPAWLKNGQTVAIDQGVNSISIIEFTVSTSTLVFSQVLSITSTSPQTVPASTVWKIESIFKKPVLGNNNTATYSSEGTFSFTVPSCAGYICIEAWGGGGGGGRAPSCCGGSGGGGGGGYGQQCFSVTPGTPYTITVGAGGAGSSSGNGGNGGTTSVGPLISATGGSGSLGQTSGAGGAGGTSTASINFTGGTGISGTGVAGGNVGAGANGGAGGTGGIYSPTTSGTVGTFPGGGGGGGVNQGTAAYGAAGASGKVIITW